VWYWRQIVNPFRLLTDNAEDPVADERIDTTLATYGIAGPPQPEELAEDDDTDPTNLAHRWPTENEPG
jgi:hypothetical protein